MLTLEDAISLGMVEFLKSPLKNTPWVQMQTHHRATYLRHPRPDAIGRIEDRAGNEINIMELPSCGVEELTDEERELAEGLLVILVVSSTR